MWKTKKSIIALAGVLSALAGVPAHAQLYNLTGVPAPPSTRTALLNYNAQYDAIFTTNEPACWSATQGCSSGAGVMDPFLQMTAPQATGVERGVNSDLAQNSLQYNESSGPGTHSLRREEISVLDGSQIPSGTPGQKYREFLLDVNESDNKPSYVLLSELKVYISDNPNTTNFDGKLSTLESWAALGTNNTLKAYDMDYYAGAFQDRAVLLDYGLLGSGSGRPDMTVYLPRIYTATGTHVYVYSRFGCSTTVGSADYDANCTAAIAAASAAGKDLNVNAEAGSEEWAVRQTVVNQEVPAPPAILGVFAAFRYMRKMRRRLQAHQAGQLAA